MYKFLNTSIKKIKFYYLLCPVCHHIFFVGPCWSWLFLIFEKSFIKDAWHNFEYVSDISLASLFLLLNISNIFIQCFYYFIAFLLFYYWCDISLSWKNGKVSIQIELLTAWETICSIVILFMKTTELPVHITCSKWEIYSRIASLFLFRRLFC